MKTLNSHGWKQYSLEAGSGVVQDILLDKIIKKGGGENNPQGPIDFTSHDNYTDKQIKQTLMKYGPGSVYYAFSLDINYPNHVVEYWFKGYMSNGKPVFKITPMERPMMAENK